MYGEGEVVELAHADIVTKTSRAVLVDFGDREVWLPLSEVEIDEDENTVTLPEWLAKDRGLWE